MWSPENLFLVGIVFLFAGFVKGTVGLGLPTVSLALLATTVGLQPAIALLLFPSITTNIWQSLAGPHLKTLLRRLWLFLACVCFGTWIGAGVLATVNSAILMAILGVILVIYATISLTLYQVPPPGHFEKPLNPIMGLASGFMTGMTGSFVVPGSLYLQALKMPRDMLIQSLGMSFTTVTIALGFSMGGFGLLDADVLGVSAMAVLPALAGMTVGIRIRNRLPEEKFRKVFFLALLILGIYISLRAFLS
ncbi:MAG: sulfite exporter TauE/SafE family protein [Alphaproteobacteria bacterium]|jgi:uncharacterized protein|nr:sulfite exporter TauE/SafE family protein [Alphaproteobacteria bacterium]MBT4085633.1 sulfite exporter TauE/SafE family protein [Alphaproteobacteria bacterium]MBT4544480.1 sulfite exporter TauE/SafE family protein [Alphaproteobacteria bacterium]MBT7746255.1 sulfite exporter TauE/SafE family protein [Alphaproteobacteria bacterium]